MGTFYAFNLFSVAEDKNCIWVIMKEKKKTKTNFCLYFSYSYLRNVLETMFIPVYASVTTATSNLGLLAPFVMYCAR